MDDLSVKEEELSQRDDDLQMAGKIGEALLEKNQALEHELEALRQEYEQNPANDYSDVLPTTSTSVLRQRQRMRSVI